MVMILLAMGVGGVPLIAFHFPFPARSLRAMINAGNVSTVPSHGSSNGLDSNSYAAEPDLVERSNGFLSVKGSRTIALGAVGRRVFIASDNVTRAAARAA